MGNVFGFNQREQVKLATKLGEQARDLEVGQSAYEDWKTLSPADKIEYELCKFENNQQLGFDKNALTQYAATQASMQNSTVMSIEQ
jgi:hypothetical protein